MSDDAVAVAAPTTKTAAIVIPGGTQRTKAWGTSFRQRLRLAPLYFALAIADRLAAPQRRMATKSATSFRPGISVVIPERDAPELLASALASVYAALAAVDEPHQVIVVVNGAPRQRYDAIVAQYPSVELLHSEQPLGFSAAIYRGLRHARHDWTFLMNNDMTLDSRALHELAHHRADDVFAIASQIFQRSADGRREETGFTDWYADAGGVRVFHADPGDDERVREHLCASGGATLFLTAALRGYARDSRCYDPFYWEDVEWSVRAQNDGMRVLYCPTSHAHHLHRASTTRFYSEVEVSGIVERNRILFDARNGISDNGADWLMRRVCELDYDAQRKFSQFGLVGRLFLRRRAAHQGRPRRPPRIADPARECVELGSSYSYQLRARAGYRRQRPVVVVVTPFCVFPARHGGARRIQGLLKTLKSDFDVVLVADEASLYDARSFVHFDGLHAVHFVQRPRDDGRTKMDDVASRMKTHCHATLVDALRSALVRYAPALVQIEYAELADLSRYRSAEQRWILGLHDAYGPADFRNGAEAAAFQQHIGDTFDAVTVCSDEDRVLISHPRIVCVPNGSSVDGGPYVPSQSLRVLFMGPFRYTQNLEGIRRFLAQCYPAIASAVPGVELVILGGDGARERAAGDPLFAQPGVRVDDHREDVAHLLAMCALTINPLMAIRGSSIKVIESLAAGRICVSTGDGARGFAGDGLGGLVVVRGIDDMTAPIIALLRDAQWRHRIESPEAARFTRYRWDHCASIQAELYRSLVEESRD